jgi:hypothetical protein
MNLPDEVQTVVLKPSEMKLLGAAAILLVLFIIGFALDITRLELLAIFGCLTVQGMRK